MPETHLDKFKKLLAELFMFDQADLDFGIYRIMNAKRDEITKFLDRDLLPQVREALGGLEQADRAAVEAELTKAIEQAKALGADAESLPKVKELRAQLALKADIEVLEGEVFSDLFSFFRRYYNEGDFLSLRRYKAGVYAIPYEGEEVKLHWANADQYYIKTSEYFRDYTFRLSDNRRVHFKLAEADTERNNNKSANGQERRFILCEQDFIAIENGELVICFEYRPDAHKRKQADLNAEAVKRILLAQAAREWLVGLAANLPMEKNQERTALDKHLADYTARNTFDYFIHKDLGGFLRREIDFFIKNEVMHLDDIESEVAPRVEQYLARIKAIRHIARKIIDFLGQIEDFQKHLWLKKKFVIETNYCITLDRVPEELYPTIAANDAQREEWVRLFSIDEIGGDLTTPKYSKPLTVDFLKANDHLLVDTKHFGDDLKVPLLHAINGLDEQLDGLLIHSENFHAIQLLSNRFAGCVQSIYIDPPYNTDSSAILYKNDYKNSSWASLIACRCAVARRLLKDEGIMCVAIDDTEFPYLRLILQEVFGTESTLGIAAVRANPAGRSTPTGFSVAHDYAVFVGRSASASVGRLPRSDKQLARYDEIDGVGPFEWVNFRKHGGVAATRRARPRMYYPIYASEGKIRIPEMEWNEAAKEWIILEEPFSSEEVVWPVDGDGEQKRWKWGMESVGQSLSDFCSRPDQEKKTGVYLKSRMNEEGTLPLTWWDKKEYSATEYGTNLLKDMFGDVGQFSFPKAIHLVEDCLRVCSLAEDETVLDFFAGSGTTGHAVVNLNREDDGKRKYILAETGEYFEAVLVPRIKKVVYSKDWKSGKPISRKGVSHFFKYVRLESYEDTLNNLQLKRTRQQGELLELNPTLREDYLLRYMLDVESKNSTSLLDLSEFEDPFNYKLKIGTGSAGETKVANVDLVETFDWLLGLRVKHMDTIRGFRVVQGTNPTGEKALVIWRNTREKLNADLDEFFLKQGYNTRDMEFDLIYVNGDNNLENLKRPDETWKVRLIEEEFKSLMFDVADV